MGERFGKNVGRHIFGGNVFQFDIARRDSLADEVEMDVDMFGSTVKCSVFRQANHALIIAVKSGWQREVVEERKFFENFVDP